MLYCLLVAGCRSDDVVCVRFSRLEYCANLFVLCVSSVHGFLSFSVFSFTFLSCVFFFLNLFFIPASVSVGFRWDPYGFSMGIWVLYELHLGWQGYSFFSFLFYFFFASVRGGWVVAHSFLWNPMCRAEIGNFLWNLSVSTDIPGLLIEICSTTPLEFNVHLCCVQCNCSEMVANMSLPSY